MAIRKNRKTIEENPYPRDANPEILVKDASREEHSTPMFHHPCTFPPEIFQEVMLNLIHNPNLNSNFLFRADILLDVLFTRDFNPSDHPSEPRILQVEGFDLERIMVRKMIPRNILVDKPLDQTCLFYVQGEKAEGTVVRHLIVYIPHINSASESPFYHPPVKGIAFLHTYNPIVPSESKISTHFLYFPSLTPPTPATERIAYHLLATIHKHGQGSEAGYEKRVYHDTIIPQAVVQNTYARLKSKYAKTLIENWVEVTDPSKHVFEDLSIAAFLIELWREMYGEMAEGRFPGFVDIGCGNGLLVHILIEEGYDGWGFDARRRKSWATYSAQARQNLQELVLIPDLARERVAVDDISTSGRTSDLGGQAEEQDITRETAAITSTPGIHSGTFERGTFIISNHADELTPWTPILAHQSSSPFISIPCCSHSLTGARFRAPPLKPSVAPSGSSLHIPDKVAIPKKTSTKPNAQASAYASLVAWVSQIASDCGWVTEKEMLRIPSTRNTAIIGRRRKDAFDETEVDIKDVVRRYGGADGWEANAMKLLKGAGKNH